MLHYWFCEASQNLSSFKRLFFHSFQWGTKGKNAEKTMYSFGIFLAFFLWSPLGNYEKNKSSKWAQILRGFSKRSICWKFQYSISKNVKSPPISGSSFSNRDPLFQIWPLDLKGQYISKQNWWAVTSPKEQMNEFVFLSWRLRNTWKLNFDFKFQAFSSRQDTKKNRLFNFWEKLWLLC